jgi:lysozyme
LEEAVESGLSFFANVRLAVNTFFGTENRTDNFYGTSAAETAATFETLDNDLNEKRIVADGYSGITGEMFFEEYLARSIEFEKNEIKNQTFDQNTISQLTSTNYAIYLIKAFGGTSGEIKVRFFENTPNPIITGFGSQTSFTSRTATTENLQVDINQSRYREFDDVFISQGKSAYKTYINTLNNNRYTETQTPSSEIGFIPLSFELILDGISGIKIYNKLNINNKFLPSNYPESLNFIITKVNHNISNNSWDTSLSTISMPKTQPYKYNPPPQSSNNTPNNTSNNTPNNTSNNNISNDSSRVDPKSLKTSLQGKEFIKKEEGFRSEPYEDGGSLSIGYGFKSDALGREITKNTRVTKEEADTVFNARVIPIYEKRVQNSITSPLTQFEFDSLVSIAYNAGEIGNRSAGNPTPLRDTLNTKNYQEAANIIPKYRTTSQGKVLSVLEKRRAKEQKIFISGNYVS